MNWKVQRETLDHLIRRRLNRGKAELLIDVDNRQVNKTTNLISLNGCGKLLFTGVNP